ncbi:lanthionine synthetase LanC family protein [Pedobacter cryoconitis]|uniref:Lanthionine synthetase-like protein n=1 Tax=Pedobacter cryoconitis TaxID=188932 RepID=A0A7X0J948_9SPHI|nr:lanthionine synthetase LanC family protein [Pedobacter cryoconitis]MBB6503025.1 hypothetical protein [Pedobacter cryoconitis]
MNKIEAKINEIYDSLILDNNESLSILIGSCGVSMFKFHYFKFFNSSLSIDEYANSLQEIAELAIQSPYPSFCTGKAGINWFFSYLHKNDYLEDEDLEAICDDNDRLAELCLEYLKKNNYDFLHGSTGIAYYLLYTDYERNLNLFYTFFEELNRIMKEGSSMIPHYNPITNKLESEKINPSLSHGLASILKVSVQCFKQNICKKEAGKMAYLIIDYLLSNSNFDKSICYYASIIDEKNDKFSRLSWCYGDLGIGYILFQSSLVFNDDKLRKFSLEILTNSTKRRSKESTGVIDAGICHGTAGIAYIYNKMWASTKDLIFKDACDYWISKTIEFSTYTDGVAGYKKYNSISKNYENSFGILEGAAGIGLVLMSYLSGDFSWDYCLLLND